MNGLWVLGGLIIAGALVALVTSWRHAGHQTDLGSVSNQWIAEHRSASGQDSHR
jgi:hypothetical protein